MEVYFSVSLFGSFVFRTDIISNSAQDALRVEQTLRLAFTKLAGYEVTRNERPSGWTAQVVS